MQNGQKKGLIDYLDNLVKSIKSNDNAEDIFKYVEIRDGNIDKNRIEISQALTDK